MSVKKSRSRVVAAGAAVLALAALTGCNDSDTPTASAPTDSAPASSAAAPSATEAPSTAPTEASEPTETAPSESPSEGSTPSDAPTASSESPDPTPTTDAADRKATTTGAQGLTKPGTTLRAGDSAKIKVSYAGSDWIGELKVTALEKAPASDYKDLGIRDDEGAVYYLRYDITYLAGKTKYPPEGSNVSWTDLHPDIAPGQKVSLINNPSFKKCTTIPYGRDGHVKPGSEDLKIGDTAKNMCHPFVAKSGTLKDVVHSDYNDQTHQQDTITWKM